jgi:hypothetical protein
MTTRLFRATVRGVEDVIVGPEDHGERWSVTPIGSVWCHGPEQIHDLVPLVTLTEDDARRITDFAYDHGWGSAGLDRLRAQLAPPRMDEPTGRGAQVMASLKDDVCGKRRWTLFHSADDKHDPLWVTNYGNTLAVMGWDDLSDPQPLKGNS